MKPIETERLILRNWRDADRDFFHEINSDETVMAFFPFRRSLEESDEFRARLTRLIDETGLGFCAFESKASGETVGFGGLARTDLAPFIPFGTIEIGWRMPQRFWGKGFASEAARAFLRQGFESFDAAEIVSFAVHDNHRSTGVMQRIGMRHDPADDFDHPRVPDSHPHLKRHVLYRLSAEEWRAGRDRPARAAGL